MAIMAVLMTSGVTAAGTSKAADAPRPNPDLEAARHRFGSMPETPPSPSTSSPVQPGPDGPLQLAVEVAA